MTEQPLHGRAESVRIDGNLMVAVSLHAGPRLYGARSVHHDDRTGGHGRDGERHGAAAGAHAGLRNFTGKPPSSCCTCFAIQAPPCSIALPPLKTLIWHAQRAQNRRRTGRSAAWMDVKSLPLPATGSRNPAVSLHFPPMAWPKPRPARRWPSTLRPGALGHRADRLPLGRQARRGGPPESPSTAPACRTPRASCWGCCPTNWRSPGPHPAGASGR